VAREFLAVIRAASIRLPASKFGVVMPLQRPSLPRYQDELLTLRDLLERGLVDMKLDNVTRIDCISTLTQAFIDDQVHLTDASGKGFVTFILSQAEVFFNSTSIDLTLQSSPHRAPPPTDPSLSRRMDQLEAAFRTRNISDNLVLARIREEIDATANRSKEDRVVINGLVVKRPLPVEIRERTEVLRDVVMELFNFLIPDFGGKITFISQGKSGSVSLPMVEVRLDKVEFASSIRRAFAEKSKSKLLTGDFEQLFITNSVNLATRVRIDVMKAIAQKVASDRVKTYVVGFVSRPVLHVKKLTDGSQTTFTFVDSILAYGNLIRPADLSTAYKRAGVAFDGQMQQNFVLMTEGEREECWSNTSGASSTTSYFRGSRGGQRGGQRGGRYQGVKRGRSPSDPVVTTFNYEPQKCVRYEDIV